MKINWSFIEPVRDQAARLRGDFSVQSEIVKLAEQQAEIDRLRKENARLRSILAAKVRPPFDDDLAGEPYAAEDRQPEPGGLGRVGQVEGGGEDGGA